jgi:hypothetical protein
LTKSQGGTILARHREFGGVHSVLVAAVLIGFLNMPHAHRSGSLKQTNKKHKGTAASKRATKAGQGAGRVEGSDSRPSAARAASKSTHDKDAARAGRLDRANQTKQRREQKRGAIWLQKRVGGGACAPKIALWVPLSPLADCAAVQSLLLNEAAGEACVTHTGAGAQAVCMTTALFAQYKQRVTFVQPARRDVMAMLELAKVADIVILVLPVQQGIEQAVDKVCNIDICMYTFIYTFIEYDLRVAGSLPRLCMLL